MSNLTNALIIVLCISAVIIIAGVSMSSIAGEDKSFMSCSGTLFSNCTGYGDNFSLSTDNPLVKLPNVNINSVNAGITGVAEEGIFASIGRWIADNTGLSFLYNIISAPSTFLRVLGLPNPYADIIAGIWYAVTLFLIISWWKGQDS